MDIESIQFVPLTQGQFAIIDYVDRDLILQHRWHCKTSRGGRYAVRKRSQSDDPDAPRSIRMHREILEARPGSEADHINGMTLDNRRSNLRSATRVQNARNQRVRTDNTSGYKGVHFERPTGKWRASITVEGRKRTLAAYTSPELAAHAYDVAARRLFGEFAALNFPKETRP